jgi:hypothetical protein
MSAKFKGVEGILVGFAVGAGFGCYGVFRTGQEMGPAWNSRWYMLIGALVTGVMGAAIASVLLLVDKKRDKRRKQAQPTTWLSTMIEQPKSRSKK